MNKRVQGNFSALTLDIGLTSWWLPFKNESYNVNEMKKFREMKKKKVQKMEREERV